MTDTPVLDIPPVVDGAAGQGTVATNGFRRMEVLIAGRVQDRQLTSPPGSPAEGDAYIVGGSATGDWAGKDNDVAYLAGGVWKFITPVVGMRMWCEGNGTLEAAELTWTGTVWAARGGRQILTDGANIDWDMSLATVAQVTLGGNRTMNAPTNIPPYGWELKLAVIQDGTGSRTLTFPATYRRANGGSLTLSTGASDIDIITFMSYGSAVFETSRSLNVSP